MQRQTKSSSDQFWDAPISLHPPQNAGRLVDDILGFHYPHVFLLSLGWKWSSPRPRLTVPRLGWRAGLISLNVCAGGGGGGSWSWHPLSEKGAAPPPAEGAGGEGGTNHFNFGGGGGGGPAFQCSHPLTDKEAAPPLAVSAEGLWLFQVLRGSYLLDGRTLSLTLPQIQAAELD